VGIEAKLGSCHCGSQTPELTMFDCHQLRLIEIEIEIEIKTGNKVTAKLGERSSFLFYRGHNCSDLQQALLV
jgi:hypothetical protein